MTVVYESNMDSLRYVDTHCHLELSDFDSDREDVIRQAAEHGVHMVTSAISRATYEKAVMISKTYRQVDCALGLDPTLHSESDTVVDYIRDHREEILCIGEVGLDFYYERDHSQRQLQERTFRAFITLAKEAGLVLQVHSRSAGARCLEILYEQEVDAVHMHAFDGKASLARIASNEYGYYFSIPTSVVRSQQKRKLVPAVNIERLLVETDSPVLGADPSVRNVPSNVRLAVQEVARIRGRQEDEIASILLENTLRLYPRIRERWNL